MGIDSESMEGAADASVLISVLMSVYNPDMDQLKAAINSIIDQTLADWEMILYDDGSELEKSKMISRASKADPRITYIRGKHNLGLGHALNISMGRASGRYIARMDGDDIADVCRFEKEIAFLEKNPGYSWVGSNAALMDDNGVWGERKMPEIPDKKDFLKFSPYVHPSVMFRREVLDGCSGYHPSHKGEDYELFMRLHSQGMSGYNIQENLHYYREDRNSPRLHKEIYETEEVGIRYRGFRELGILNIKTMLYVIKPVVIKAMPDGVYSLLRRRLRKEEYEQ